MLLTSIYCNINWLYYPPFSTSPSMDIQYDTDPVTDSVLSYSLFNIQIHLQGTSLEGVVECKKILPILWGPVSSVQVGYLCWIQERKFFTGQLFKLLIFFFFFEHGVGSMGG